jgi:glutathione S-transferase
MKSWKAFTLALLSVAISASTFIGGCQALLLRQPAIIAASRGNRRATTASNKSGPCCVQRRALGASMLLAATQPSDVTTPSDEPSVLTDCKLLYFGIPGRGEAIRLALAIGGVAFEDHRVPFPAWGKVKPTTPWGTLPVLELADGSQLAQARSVLRFVGKHTHPSLYPSDDTDPLVAQRVDELMDALEDMSAAITNVGQGLDKEEKEAARLVAVSQGGTVYELLAKMDAFIQANGVDGYAVGADMNIASILTFTTIGRLVGGVFFGVPPTVCDPFPNIQRVRKTVGSHSAVVAWYDARIEQQKSIDRLSPAEQILVNCRNM